MNVVLYGAGGYLNDRVDLINSLPETVIVGVSDGDSKRYGQKVFDHTVEPIDQIKNHYDYIVITSVYAIEIKQQLICRGIEEKRIMRLREYEAYANRNKIINSSAKDCDSSDRESILAITPVVEYNGAFLALLYLLEELNKKYGYSVSIAASRYKEDLLQIIQKKGVHVFIRPNMEFEKKEDYGWANQFDYVIINTLLMRRCLLQFDPQKTIWWLHEPKSFYDEERNMWDDFLLTDYSDYKAYSVSATGQRCFNNYFPNHNIGIMEYGIPDTYISKANENVFPIIIAVIGYVTPIKGQDIFAHAMEKLSESCRDKCEFWFIGNISNTTYCRDVKQIAGKYNTVFWGEVSHAEIENMYSNIDVVVSPSREDTISIAMAEGLMNHKICIVSDSNGMAQYLHDGVDAFIFECENDNELALKMEYVVDHFGELSIVAENGRKVYDDYFSLEQVGKRFLGIVGGR